MGKLKGFYLLLFNVLLCAFIAAGQIGHAVETFQNNLLKIDFSQNAQGEIKLILYTSKPYLDQVTVNKKSDFEYIILMPETANSLTAKTILKAVSDSVKSVEVKTQQYENQVKGYTKITILSVKPIEITPKAQILKSSDYKMSDKDYSDLMAQTSKKTLAKKVQASTPKIQVVQKPVTKKAESYKAIIKTASKPSQKTFQSNSSSKKIEQSKPVIPQKPVQKKAPVKIKTQSTEPLYVAKSIPVIQEPTINNEPEPPVNLKNESKTEKPLQTVSTQVLNPKTVEPKVKTAEKVGQLQLYKNKLKDKINKLASEHVGGNLYTLAGLAIIPIILLLLFLKIAGKTANKLKKQKAEFVKNLQDAPSTVTDYSEKISDDMTWKEKFQTYVEASQPQHQAAAPASEDLVETAFHQEPEISSELDDLFYEESTEITEPLYEDSESVHFEEEINFEQPEELESSADHAEFGMQPESLSSLDEEIYQSYEYPESSIPSDLDEVIEQESLGDDISIDDLFEESNDEINSDYSVFEEEFVAIEEEPEEEVDEFIQSEFAIDNEKGFYLVDFEDSTALVGHIAEEIFVIKRFDSRVSAVLQARLNEQKGDSVSYMVRVANFKGIVEVTPEKMELLIEL